MQESATARRGKGSPYGTHRAGGSLPQPAEVLDADLHIYANELRLEVELLNIDSSSLRQIAVACGHDVERAKQAIREIVTRRGKMHNPVTRSGGVLVGRIAEIGAEFPDRGVALGDRICPIVSLSAIPLVLTAIRSLDFATNQAVVSGGAVLFECTTFGKLPDDFPLSLAVALIDICGAPARLVPMLRPGDTVGILGAGKAGLVSLYAAREAVGSSGRIVVADIDDRALADVRRSGVADAVIAVDLQQPVETARQFDDATAGVLCDVVVSVTNVGDTEGAAILATRPKGRALLFGMATSFQAAALSAEAMGRDIEMIIGNGFVEGCIEDCFNLVRRHPDLRRTLLARMDGKPAS